MSSTTIISKALPSRNPDPSSSKSHHIGSPPTAFRNPWPSFTEHGRFDIFRVRFGSSPEKNHVPVPEGANGTRSEELVKVLKPTWGVEKKDRLRATWIGHASWLIEGPAAKGTERGVRVLLDPVFSERTSPFTFIGPKRYSPTPCTVDELPDVDLIVISHNHYDHLDFETVTTLYKRLKGKVHFAVPLGLKPWFVEHVGVPANEITESDWWESTEIQFGGLDAVTLTCTPTQHFSKRTLRDGGKTLWCSWALDFAGGKKVYFAGDTAYQAHDAPSPCPAFAQIGASLGPFDLALLPIGLYSPPSFMASVHVHPEQALEIHKVVKSKLSIGMHYGTVRGGLSEFYEDVRDPPRRWREAAQKEGLWNGGGVEGDGSSVDTSKDGVGLCHIGETVVI